MEPDWDLLAVVRGCSSAAPTKPTTVAPPPVLLPQLPPPPPPRPAAEPTYETRSYGSQSLLDLYKPFFPSLKYKYPTPAPRPAAAAAFPRLPEKLPQTPPKLQPPPQLILFRPHFQQPQQILFQQHLQQINLSVPISTAVANSPTHHRDKKRKTLQTKVCQVPAEGLSSDMWAWRKYGQKPIKGSPYPRGYYRCSTSKICLARKMVERSRLDPTMFIVTYTSEHNHPMPTHRNSLSGSTRKKRAAAGSSSPTASLSPTNTEKADMAKDDSGNEMEFPDMFFSDDFFKVFEDLDDDTQVGDGLPDPVQESLEVEFPWESGGGDTSSAAVAAGGS